MEITIPSWAIWIMGTFGGGWVVWMVFLTKMAFESKAETLRASDKDAVILNKISEVEKKIDENKSDLNTKLDKIEAKIERLFGTEFAFMKQSLMLSQSQGSKSV